VFDSAKARVEGTEAAKYVASSSKQQAKQEARQLPGKKVPKWKREHEQFIAVLRGAKGGSSNADEQNSDFPEEPVDDGLTPCPHCGRRFNETNAERHIKICLSVFKGKTKISLPSNPGRGTIPKPANVPSNTTPKKLGATMGATPTRPAAKVANGRPAGNVPAPTLSPKRQQQDYTNVKSKVGIPTKEAAMVSCPHCTRKFEKHAAQRHIPICLNVFSKPKQAGTPVKANHATMTRRPF
jgi:uncharacterized Zn-finger protein